MGQKATGKNSERRRFEDAARELGLDTPKAKEAFERAFGKIVPPKRPPQSSPEPVEDESKDGE